MASRDRRPIRDVQPSFRMGLNLAADESHLLDEEVRRAENARLTEYGGITRRGGTRKLHASALGAPSTVRGIYVWRQASSTPYLAIANGTLYTSTYGTSMTWSSQVGSLSTSVDPSMVQFRDGSNEVVYIADGGLLNKWNGTTLTVDIASTGSPKVLAVYNERLYGITLDSDTLYWSALSNGDTLGIAASGGGSAVIRTFGNQRLTGLLPLGASLLLFHVDGISRFTGTTIDDIAISTGTQGVAQDVGTLAPFSIVQVENVGFFASTRGIYQVTEGGVTDISAKISPLFRELAAADYTGIRGVHNEADREVWFYVPTVGVLVYNYRLQAWSGPWTGGYDTSNVFAAGVDTNTRPIVLRGTTAGFVEQCDYPDIYKDSVASDASGGSTYDLAVQCHRMFAGDPAREKSLRWGWVLANLRGSTTPLVTWATNRDGASIQISADAGSSWDESGATWDTVGESWDSELTDMYERPLWGSGRYVDVTLSDSGVSDAVYSRVEIEGFDMTRR